ncbi:MAG: hypothetical protein SFY81_02710 [Verrucomicrobiota bacterium]|nr:hypothetical protein [Verrucomicrobiota bacterium]
MQAFPSEIAQAGEKAKEKLECSLNAVASLHERGRLELTTLVSTMNRMGAEFNKALETATKHQCEAVESGAKELQSKIEQEFQKQNLPALSTVLTEFGQNSSQTLAAAHRLNEDAKRFESDAEAHFKSAESHFSESLKKLEGLNWKGAWSTCFIVSCVLVVMAIIGIKQYLNYRSEGILANQIAVAAATIEENQKAFQELAIANIRLKITRSLDSRNGQPIRSGFAIVVENAQLAEMRDSGTGKAGYIFLNSPTPEEQIRTLQVAVEKVNQALAKAKK